MSDDITTEDISNYLRLEKRISELEASSASHTEAMEILIQSNNTLNTKVKNNGSNLANEVFRLGNEIAESQQRYDQLSNWSVGIDLHIGELEKNHKNTYNLALEADANTNLLFKDIAELRDALQKSGVKWDFRLDEQGGFIDELRECLLIAAQRDNFLSDNDGLIIQELNELKEWSEEIQVPFNTYAFNDIRNIQEVLQDLGKKVYDYIGAKNFGSWNDFI